MGVLIKIDGANFTNYIDTVDIPSCEHNIVHVPAVDPTATNSGNKEYWHCTICGGYWLDAALTIDTTESDVVIPAIGSYPVTDTLKGLYYLGGTIEDSLVNHAEGGSDATVTGSVKASDGYVTISGKEASNYINTNIIPTEGSTTTVVALFRVHADTGYEGSSLVDTRPIVGNRPDGVWLANNRISFTGDGATYANFEGGVINSDAFALVAMSFNAGGCHAKRYTNGGVVELAKYDGTITDAWTKAFRIGGAYSNASYHAIADIALVSIHEGVLDDEKLTEICEFVRKYGKQKGLIIE